MKSISNEEIMASYDAHYHPLTGVEMAIEDTSEYLCVSEGRVRNAFDIRKQEKRIS